jgi:hypothetical protein
MYLSVNAVVDQNAMPPLLHIFLSPPASLRDTIHLRSRVGVHLPLAAGHGDVDEAAGVLDALLRAALGGLLLLLWFDLFHIHQSASPSLKEAL